MRMLLLLCVVTWHVSSSNATSALSVSTVKRSINTFSNNFFKAVAENKSGNLICSPIGVSMVLSMATFGAEGNTEQQLRSVLALDSNDTVTKTGIQSLIDTLANFTEVELRLKNKILLAEKFYPKSEFTNVTVGAFRSGVEAVDSIETRTNNRIKDHIEPASSWGVDSFLIIYAHTDNIRNTLALVLFNEVSFTGNWTSKFNVTQTKPRPFHVNGTTVINVPTMYRFGSYCYGMLPEVNATFVRLPYKSKEFSDAVSMFIILPNEINGLAELKKNLKKVTAEKLLRGRKRDVNVYLPKFKIESFIDLQEPLNKFDLTDMFTDAANFTGIVDAPPLKAYKIMHMAVIEVNEGGGEAAAVTGSQIFSRGPLPNGSIEFVVNRPFVSVIVTTSNVSLLSAIITNPVHGL